ncbi:hypothetical protein R1sor_027410 [Riccia sorocarpa]|uniref:Uncharacterized protein n=1 Tax=Riccia sorocarpa TaxID=122646 RepID=A0ABD3GE40_9MARC
MAVSSGARRGLLAQGSFLSPTLCSKAVSTRVIAQQLCSGQRRRYTNLRIITCVSSPADQVIRGPTFSPLANAAATSRSLIIFSPDPGVTYGSSALVDRTKRIRIPSLAQEVLHEDDVVHGQTEESGLGKIKEYVQQIKMMFHSQGDGAISVSPYDTAWVALVPALDGSERPQFPKCLEWIETNQSPGGSWGDEYFFLVYDRIVNTLACVIALKTWGENPDAVEKGVKFIQDNLHRMEYEENAHMPIGFEIVFPKMLKHAQTLGLDLPYEAPIIKSIEAARNKKLEQIPMEIVHKHPTTLLHSLEGVHELLDWDKLLKLQSLDGSLLNSPASTACALMYTKDERCLAYIEKVLDKFGNAVPNVYPVDLFERMWMVDRLERLGIARYFEKEIRNCLDYVYEHWTDNGLAWSTTANVKDVDDTAMGFRLLRQHGYDVRADVFRQFRGENGEFFCFPGQSGQAVTGMFNLYRASQTGFPGETILEEAFHFTRAFLEEKLARGECHDKWIITKDLEGEVAYALNVPRFCSLPLIENQVYSGQYAADDVWIGKCLYRMYNVNNDTFLALAKTDFDLCRLIHQTELQQILRWYRNRLVNVYDSRRTYEWYFSAASHLRMTDRATARHVSARNCVLTSVTRDFFQDNCCLEEIRAFVEATKSWDFSPLDMARTSTQALFEILYTIVNAQIREGFLEQDRGVGPYFRAIWLRWVESVAKEAEWQVAGEGGLPSLEEYSKNCQGSASSEPIIRVTAFFLGEPVPADVVSDNSKHRYLMELTNTVGRLCDDIRQFKSAACELKLNAVSINARES